MTKNALSPKLSLKTYPIAIKAAASINHLISIHAMSCQDLIKANPFKLIINYTGDVK